MSDKGKAQNAVTAARHHATEYLDIETDPAFREEIYARLEVEIEIIKGLKEKYRKRIREEHELMELLDRAKAEHERTHSDIDRPGARQS